MGTKRPFDEEIQEFIKHPKHVDYGSKSTLFSDDKLPPEKSQDVRSVGEANGLESSNVFTVPDTVYKDFQTSAPLPLVTGIHGDEGDCALGPVFCSDLFPEFFEFNMPRRQLIPYEDAYSSLLYSSPRKEIPIGLDHQADVPEFDPEIARNYGMSSDRETYFSGVCIIQMPNTDYLPIDGQMDCKCKDSGSIQCVQEHVKEARSKLKESLGDKTFVDLGFSDMGEEVASRWTEEEERIFHEVVYYNPASLGKNFWGQLPIVFPSRTKKELVSYYFNVFILRRRAVQNRSNFLEIDSDDDDDWCKSSFGLRAEDQDFVVGDDNDNDNDNDDSSSEDGCHGQCDVPIDNEKSPPHTYE